MSRLKRGQPEPETRVGICCGCDESSMPLFKIPGLFRYRCARCFAQEMGYSHHLAPRCTCDANAANRAIGNHFGDCPLR